MSDRTVHGIAADGAEIVRYDRAGKWYLEYTNGPRKRINVLAAARLATTPAARAFPGRPGGGKFDYAIANEDSQR